MTYHEIDNGIGSSLHSVILWQYENAERLKAFIDSMCEAAYLAVDDFWDKWATFRTNVDLAASKENATFSLSVIGATCGIPRPDDISDAMYAKLIKCRMKLAMTTSMSVADYYSYIDELFDSRIILTENPDNKVMSVGFSINPNRGFNYTDWTFSGDLIPDATYSISSSVSGDSKTFTLSETSGGATSSVATFIGNEYTCRIVFTFDRTINDETVEASVLAETPTADESNLYHSEDSNAYGKYWMILPTGVKRGISSWGGTVFGFDKRDAGNGTNSKVPAIGPFKTKFMTKYQYEYTTGAMV